MGEDHQRLTASPRLAKGDTISVEVCSDIDDLSTMEADWRDLAASAASYSVSQGFDYADLAWRTKLRSPHDALAVITVRQGNNLACVWPLYVRRVGRLRIATHLGCGSSDEYSGPLLCADTALATLAAHAALACARRFADTLEVYATDPASPIAPALAAQLGAYCNTLTSPVVALVGQADFASWSASKSKSFRSGLKYDRKRLADQGIAFREAATEGQVAELADWLFENKRQWLAQRGIATSWILDPTSRTLFKRLMTTPDVAASPVRGFALKLGDRTIAACICFVSKGALEFFMTGFDTEFHAYSPGNLLVEDCVRWAIARGLDFDFRITMDPYKLRWADRTESHATCIAACTIRGVPRVLGFKVNRLRYRLAARLGPMLKRYISRPGVRGQG